MWLLSSVTIKSSNWKPTWAAFMAQNWNPCRKLGWGTLCYIYSVLLSLSAISICTESLTRWVSTLSQCALPAVPFGQPVLDQLTFLYNKVILFTYVDFGLPNELCGRGFVDFMYYKSCTLTLFRYEKKTFFRCAQLQAAIIYNAYSSLIQNE